MPRPSPSFTVLQTATWFALSLLGCADADLAALSDQPDAAHVQSDQQALTEDGRFFPTGSNLDCNALACDRFAPVRLTADTKRTRGSNSQTSLPGNLALADVDGDGHADYVQYYQNRIFVSAADYERTGIASLVLNRSVERLITGDFYGAGWDQLCAYASGRIQCFGMDRAPGGNLKVWFEQNVALNANEDIVVADYDGDLRDEMFIYNRTTGAMRMLEVVGSNRSLSTKTDWDPANLSRVASANMKFRAGDYHGDGRDDLIAVNPAGQILVFKSALSDGKTVFWWAFTTVSGFVGKSESLTLARVNNDMVDDFVLHDTSTGAVRFHSVGYNAGRPAALPITTGQIEIAAGSILTMNRSHVLRNEPGSAVRDDAFVYKNGTIYKSTPRYSTSPAAYTYWRAHRHSAPNNNQGWPAQKKKKALFLKCKFKDETAEMNTAQFYKDLTGRLVDYFADNTYGGLDLSDSVLKPNWIQMDLETTSQPRREEVGAECVKQAGGMAGFDMAVIFQNKWTDWGAKGVYASVRQDAHDVWVTAHEMAHVLGWKVHPKGEAGNGYGDAWDPMSARTRGHVYTNWLGVNEGPGLGVHNRLLQGHLPAFRTKTISSGSGAAGIKLAALNRPEANGYLSIRINTAGSHYYLVSYRERSGYDRGIPNDAVLVHKVDGADYYLMESGGAERTAGASYVTPDGITIAVSAIDAASHRATVDVR
jgi:hypothetical protein